VAYAIPLAAPARAPIVRLAATSIGESEAVRAVVSRATPGLPFVVRFRVLDAAASADGGCVASASLRVKGSAQPVRVALVPRRVWCAGTAALRVAAVRRGARTGEARLRVRPPQAFGRGNVVGHLLLGPTCPVERVDDPCDPVPRPDPVTLLALDASGAETARTVTLADASFALDLPAGSYTLHADRTAVVYPSIADVPLVVTNLASPSRPQRVIVSGDTGIR
jgi:hypothetical protein